MGSAERKVLNAGDSTSLLSTHHSPLSTSSQTPTLTLPRSTGRGDIFNRASLVLVACFLCLSCLCADNAAPYASNFEKADVGKLPEDFVVLAGSFTIAQADGRKVLESPADPLDSSALLFGPENALAGDVSARIWGQSMGRRFPEFAVGAGDAGGYKLWVIPGQAKLELRKAETPVASAPYRAWKSRAWTRLHLRVSKTDGGWKIEGKAWPDGSAEPQKWDISLTDPKEPPKGRASLWGTPFSGQPIRYDDLRFTPSPG